MCYLQHPVVDGGIVGCQSCDQVVDQRIPLLPKVAPGDLVDGIAELRLAECPAPSP